MSEDIFEGVRTPEADISSTKIETLPRVQAFVSASRLSGDLQFNPTDMDTAMMNQAALYSHYGQALAKATMQRDQLERRLELLEAQLDTLIRDKATTEGKKITEAAVQSRIKIHPVYNKTRLALSEAEAVFAMIRTTLTSLEMKRDMMVQVNKNADREFAYSSALVAAGQKTENLKENFLRARAAAASPEKVSQG